MNKIDHRLYFTLALAGLLFLVPQPACAYIDAATGSYVMQMLFGVFFSALFWCKSLVSRFHRRSEQLAKTDEPYAAPELTATGS